MNTIYLDNAATTPLDPDVFEKMKPYFINEFYNPGGIYTQALNIKSDISKARAQVADLLCSRSQEIYFVDGGTEANNIAILGVIKAFKEDNPKMTPRIITSAVEHASVHELYESLRHECDVVVIPVNQEGRIDIKKLKESINENTILISIAYANGEIGSIEDIKGIAKAARYARKQNDSVYPYVHTDAVQAASFENINILQLGVDMMTISGSKIYGPKKIAALFIKTGTKIRSIMYGGDQESKLRPGTENVPYIIGFAFALSKTREIHEQERERLAELKKYFITELLAIDTIINTPQDNSLPHIVSITVPELSSEELVIRLGAEGILCSMKSACKSGDDGDSHVIKALRDHDTQSIRFSLGRSTKKEEVLRVITVLKKIVDGMREVKNTYSHK